MYGKVYECDHPRYNRCTLYLSSNGLGLAVIQQHFDKETKHTWWAEVDPWIANDLYLSEGFRAVFDSIAKVCDERGIYPTIELRKLMFKLRMKPLKREDWEA